MPVSYTHLAERTSDVKDDALAQIDERRSEADEALDAAAGELASAQTKICLLYTSWHSPVFDTPSRG